jgi:hypothetical protein
VSCRASTAGPTSSRPCRTTPASRSWPRRPARRRPSCRTRSRPPASATPPPLPSVSAPCTLPSPARGDPGRAALRADRVP